MSADPTAPKTPGRKRKAALSEMDKTLASASGQGLPEKGSPIDRSKVSKNLAADQSGLVRQENKKGKAKRAIEPISFSSSDEQTSSNSESESSSSSEEEQEEKGENSKGTIRLKATKLISINDRVVLRQAEEHLKSLARLLTDTDKEGKECHSCE